jgi:23S rRNA pseudouridine1911/1915/1917 synthase
MRLDRFLARWFPLWSRTELGRGIRSGLVLDADGRALRASHRVRPEELLQVWIPGLAPTEPPPGFPEILHEDPRVIVVDKPAGMMCHPAGSRYVYALVGLAKERFPDEDIDLVHRIDADTSGIVAISRDKDANVFLKEAFQKDDTVKTYRALVRGHPAWEQRIIAGPIGPAEGPVRIQMAVRPDGQPSWTEVRVLGRKDSPVGPIARVECRIRTGRTHQIRVHLAHLGLPLLGDRLYGGRCELFLDVLEDGVTDAVIAEAGAPRHALHGAGLSVAHPDGTRLDVVSKVAADLRRWWERPEVLPLDRP